MIEHGDKIIAEAQHPRTLIVSPRNAPEICGASTPSLLRNPQTPSFSKLAILLLPLPFLRFHSLLKSFKQTHSSALIDTYTFFFFFELIYTFFFFSSELTIGSVIQSFFCLA